MLEICALASGSKGNCVVVAGAKTKIIVDIGLSLRRYESALSVCNLKAEAISACLITHEHIDHIRGAKRITEKYRLPLHAHPSCANILINNLGVKQDYLADFIMSGFSIGELFIEPFEVSHDSVFTVGYRISDAESSFVYATDCGYCSDKFLAMAKDADTVLIESNHDVNLLLQGRYPAHLKRRILSNNGHLSNLACACAIEKLANGRPKNFILAHISEENNIYELALSYTQKRLTEAGLENVKLFVATQNQPTGFIRCKNDGYKEI